jgi:hypothetical protein
MHYGLCIVMLGLVSGVHAFSPHLKTWMAGTSPAMTNRLQGLTGREPDDLFVGKTSHRCSHVRNCSVIEAPSLLFSTMNSPMNSCNPR